MGAIGCFFFDDDFFALAALALLDFDELVCRFLEDMLGAGVRVNDFGFTQTILIFKNSKTNYRTIEVEVTK